MTRMGLGMGLLALMLAAPWGSASAQTMSYAQAGALLAKSCGPTVEKYCRNVNLGSGQLFPCLMSHQAEMPAQCATDLAAVQASIAKRAAAQVDVFTVCRNDAREYCKGVVPGDANLLTCLIDSSKVVGRLCSQTITDAGWR